MQAIQGPSRGAHDPADGRALAGALAPTGDRATRRAHAGADATADQCLF